MKNTKKIKLGNTKFEVTLSSEESDKQAWLKRFKKDSCKEFVIAKEKFTNYILINDAGMKGKEYLIVVVKIVKNLMTMGEINETNIDKLKDFMFDLWSMKHFKYVE